MHTIRTLGPLLLCTAPALGQVTDSLPDPPALMGSPLHLALAPGLAAGGGSANSSLYVAEFTVAGGAAGYVASSALYRLEGGVVASGPTLAPTAPLLASVTPRLVRAAGGESITLHGLELAPNGLAPSVRFAGVPAASVAVSPSGIVTALTPPLVDGFANPLGPVAVEVETALGSATLADALIAGPAYLQSSPARIASQFTITHYGLPGALGLPSWGAFLPGVGIPIGGIAGSIVMFPIFQTLSVFETFDASGVSSTSWPIPEVPTLVGLPLDFQSIEIESLAPLSASFTNAVRVLIEF